MYNPQLKTFICTADSGSFNKASEKLYITPAAVIKQINILEDNLGVKLFERTHRGLILTNAGRHLYQDAKYIIQYCNESVIRAKNAMQEGDQTIRIGTSQLTPSVVIIQSWPLIQELCPALKFKIVSFENTEENAREILGNLGQNIDVVAGIFDESMLRLRKCSAMELKRLPLRCALSLNHPLSRKEELSITDLYGEKVMIIRRGWSKYIDSLRDWIGEKHPDIEIVDFDFYDIDAFNRCENNGYVLISIDNWAYVHPLLKTMPVDWDFTIPFGIMHSHTPSEQVQRFLDAVRAQNISQE